MRSIFISYRRRDTFEFSQALYDWLSKHHQGAHIFRDVDSVPHGLDFRSVILEEISSSDAMLVVIGPLWEISQESFSEMSDDTRYDYVRLEIEGAIKLGIPIVTVLTGGATQHVLSNVPDSMCQLVRCPSIEMSMESFGGDALRLSALLSQLPRAQRRVLLNRERLANAAEIMLTCGVRVGACACATSLVIVLLYATIGWPTDVLNAGLVVGTVASPVCGAVTGWRCSGWLGLILGAVLMPLAVVVGLFAILVFHSVLLLVAMHVLGLDEPGRDDLWGVALGFGMFFPGMTGALVAARSVLAKRAMRYRARYLVRQCFGFAAAGAAAGGISVGSALAAAGLAAPAAENDVVSAIALATVLSTAGLLIGAIGGAFTGLLTLERR